MTEKKQTNQPTSKGVVELTECALDQAAGGAKKAPDWYIKLTPTPSVK